MTLSPYEQRAVRTIERFLREKAKADERVGEILAKVRRRNEHLERKRLRAALDAGTFDWDRELGACESGGAPDSHPFDETKCAVCPEPIGREPHLRVGRASALDFVSLDDCGRPRTFFLRLRVPVHRRCVPREALERRSFD